MLRHTDYRVDGFWWFPDGITVGATPGLAGPMAMAISLPILISIFGFSEDALLPVLGLIGIMKGATIGGACQQFCLIRLGRQMPI